MELYHIVLDPYCLLQTDQVVFMIDKPEIKVIALFSYFFYSFADFTQVLFHMVRMAHSYSHRAYMFI